MEPGTHSKVFIKVKSASMVIESQAYGLHPQDIEFIVAQLQKGKVGIVPTDTVYAFCSLADNKEGFELICRLKHLEPRDAMMSMICKDLSQASAYFTVWDTPTYRILHRNLPGPFTFILNAGHESASFLKNKRKTLGLRIPHHKGLASLMQELDKPLLVSSVMHEDDIEPFFTDADELIQKFEKHVGFIVLDMNMIQETSTVVDMTGEEPVVIRQSKYEVVI
jgi:tRNA threonylcarbamoyl adenosine modification protein (Sua5/YciO/YrdC/YwlC family)